MVSAFKRFSIPFALVLFFVAPHVTFAAFGISPPFLNTDHLVPGATFSQTIYLVQDQPNTNLEIKATLSVPDSIKSWITIDKGFDFVIPQGTRQFPVVVTVSVPKDAQLNKYSGNLVFATAPVESGQVTIALGVNLAINLTVGNNVYESYSVPLISLPDIEEGWSPRVLVRFVNGGNIPESFDAATFEVYDQFDSVRLAYVEKKDGFPATPPFSTQEYTLQFPTDFHLGVGDYWGNVTFYKNSQVVATQKIIFHVLPVGSLSSPFEVVIEELQRYWLYILVALGAVFYVGKRIYSGVMAKRSRL